MPEDEPMGAETMKNDTTRTQKVVLCVDDDPGMRSALTRLLNPLGHRVFTAADGARAVQMAEEREPDLVLLDLMMPGMDGYEVLRRLRELGMAETPVVMLTGKDSGDDMMSGYQEGAVYYITKPFKNEYVLNVVEYLIGDLTDDEREFLAHKL